MTRYVSMMIARINGSASIGKQKIAYKTVLALVQRLKSKGSVLHESQGEANLNIAATKREDGLKRTVLDFVDRPIGDDPGHLLTLTSLRDTNASSTNHRYPAIS